MLVRFDFPVSFRNLVDDFLSTDVTPSYANLYGTFPALDVAEYEHESVVLAELPGVKKEDVKITMKNGILTISGERKPYEIPENGQILMSEVQARSFNRSIELPHEVDVDKVSADMENGILQVHLPKAEAARARTIEIK